MRQGSPLGSRACCVLAGRYAWVAFAVDFAFADYFFAVYAGFAGESFKRWNYHSYEVLRPYLMTRASVIASRSNPRAP